MVWPSLLSDMRKKKSCRSSFYGSSSSVTSVFQSGTTVPVRMPYMDPRHGYFEPRRIDEHEEPRFIWKTGSKTFLMVFALERQRAGTFA